MNIAIQNLDSIEIDFDENEKRKRKCMKSVGQQLSCRYRINGLKKLVSYWLWYFNRVRDALKEDQIQQTLRNLTKLSAFFVKLKDCFLVDASVIDNINYIQNAITFSTWTYTTQID